MSGETSILVTASGRDEPGLAEALFATIAPLGLAVRDIEQIQVHGHLLLCVEVVGDPGDLDRLRAATAHLGAPTGEDGTGALTVTVAPLDSTTTARRGERWLVTLLAPELPAESLAGLFAQIAAAGTNVDRIVRLASYPVVSYELLVSGGDPDRLRRDLGREAARLQVDVAVQRAGLHRRAKHLIVLDVDSTLLQGEVIDQLAAHTGHADEVAAVTAAAMAGELDFEAALIRRVRLLAGIGVDELEAVRSELRLAPGARTLIRTLKRLGFVTAIVSGGFLQLVAPLAEELGIDHAAANDLEMVDGRLTGRLVGPIVDRPGKAASLVRFAGLAGVPLAQTIAVGDGANDIDMLSVAGLGIAFNAKPVVRDAADTALNVPYLDAILYLLGISRDDVEAADRGSSDEEG